MYKLLYIERPTNLTVYTFSISVTVSEIFEKTVLGKSLSGATGSKDVLIWVEIGLKFLF